jgi:iron complex outermembrane receptor protein
MAVARRARWKRRPLAIACAGSIASIAVSTIAQGQPAAEPSDIIRVEVTGSRIARVDAESGLPVQTLTRQELVDGGVQTPQDLLDRISANQSFGSWNEAKGVGSTLVGFTGASLRGLGSQRTLILLNGRRLAPYALSGGQSVDLSGIPSSAIERVEVLKDGASAVYGTDALGGVINFILRKDYAGVEANANYFATEEGGGNSGRVSVTAGIGDLAKDRYNVFVSADYFKQDPLKATEREATKTAYLPSIGVDSTSMFSYPANISQTNFFTGEVYGFPGIRNPTVPFPGGATESSCLPPASFPTIRAGRFQCRFDFASVIEVIPESEKANVVGRLTWQIDPDHQVFAEGSYYRGTFTQRISPTPVIPNGVLPATSPYYPTAYVAGLAGGDPTAPLQLIYRTVELGPRTDEATAEQWNAVAGMQGTVSGWDYAFAGTWTWNRQVDEYLGGAVYESRFRPLLTSGVVNPFGPNSDSVLDLMRATQVTGPANDNRAANYGADVKVSKAVYDLPSGSVAVAFGGEVRRETLEQSNSDFVVSGDVLGGAGAIPSIVEVDRTVWSLFGEINVPITKTFEANVAVRHDDYSDFGGTTNPKLTLRWQPAKSLLLRAAYGTGFRAPTLSDIFLPQSQSFIINDDPDDAIEDPLRCPVTQVPPDCSLIPVRTGGNRALQPETSDQLNAGIVLEPASGLSLSLDYYRVKVANVITIVPLDTIFGDYDRWAPGYVVRKPPDAQHPELPGPIDYVVQYQTNVGEITTSGVDVNVQWRGPSTQAGQFSFVLNGTYVIDYEHSGYESAEVPPSVGTRGPDGAIARYRQYAQLGWSYGPWGATLANNHQSGYSEHCTPSDPSGCETRRVGTWSIWDVQARYTGFANATLTLGIRNLLDRAPPVSNQSTDFQVGYDPTYADPRGRIYYGALRYVFK